MLWSPIGSDLVYVHDNDIYHMIFNHGQTIVRRLTESGKPGVVYNGIPDWVYEGNHVNKNKHLKKDRLMYII